MITEAVGSEELAIVTAKSAVDDNSDDNRDDNCFIHDAIYRGKLVLSCLVTASACSWQCGGQGFESP